MGVDAIIVQGPWHCRDVKKWFKGLAIHASTQMALHNSAGVAAAASMGIKRVILARELSFDEIAAIQKSSPCELEVFIRLRDVQHYPYLKITGFGAFSAPAGGAPRSGRLCALFRPYTDVQSMRRLEQLGQTSFPDPGLQPACCQKAKRPCINYSMAAAAGPAPEK